MLCTMKSKQMTVATTPKLGAKIPNATADGLSFTNVAGVAEVKGVIYCVKANSKNQSILVSTPNYKTTATTQVNMTPLNYYCVGLTTDGTYLYLMGQEKINDVAYGRLIKASTAGAVIKVYNLDNTTTNGVYQNIAYCGNNSFYMSSSDDSNKTLKITKYNLSSGYDSAGSFTVTNSGYAEMIQDMYFDKENGLFIVTNQKDDTGSYAPCNNVILLFNLKNRPSGTLKATSRFRMNFSKTAYKQFNIESMCLTGGKMVAAANVVLASDSSADGFVYVNDLDFNERGTYFITHQLNVGRKLNNKQLTVAELVDPKDDPVIFSAMESLTYDGEKVVGIKIGSKPNVTENCYAIMFSLDKYMDIANSKLTWGKIFSYGNAKEHLYHANSLNYSNGYLYVGCTEPMDTPRKSIVKMKPDGTFVKRYYFDYRTNVIVPYTGNTFILISGEDPQQYYDPYLKKNVSVRHGFVGTLSDTTSEFVVKDTFYFRDTNGMGVLDLTYNIQDAYFNENHGLYLAVSRMKNTEKNMPSENYLCHMDITKYDMVTLVNGEKVKLVTPDFTFVYKDQTVFADIEYESPTVDVSTGKMVLGVNAHKVDGSTYDCMVEIPDFDLA